MHAPLRNTAAQAVHTSHDSGTSRADAPRREPRWPARTQHISVQRVPEPTPPAEPRIASQHVCWVSG